MVKIEQDRLRHVVPRLPVSDDDASMVYNPEELPWIEKEQTGFYYD